MTKKDILALKLLPGDSGHLVIDRFNALIDAIAAAAPPEPEEPKSTLAVVP